MHTWAKRAIALTISVLLSMTMTAPVPRPDWASFKADFWSEFFLLNPTKTVAFSFQD